MANKLQSDYISLKEDDGSDVIGLHGGGASVASTLKGQERNSQIDSNEKTGQQKVTDQTQRMSLSIVHSDSVNSKVAAA